MLKPAKSIQPLSVEGVNLRLPQSTKGTPLMHPRTEAYIEGQTAFVRGVVAEVLAAEQNARDNP